MVRVAAGVLQRRDGRILLAQRLDGTPYAGYWEFPGGKLEPGESPAQALLRELHEELGIDVLQSAPWLTRVYVYPHATVELNFFRVLHWTGEPRGRDGQALSWEAAGAVRVAPVLPANGVVLNALTLPTIYGISTAEDLGQEVFMQRCSLALDRGLRLVQVREKQLVKTDLECLTRRVVALARPFGARVLLNGAVEDARAWDCDGVHLTSAALRATRSRPEMSLCAASCHDADELALARDLGVDFAVLGPVRETPSHPDAASLGWERWTAITSGSGIPIYALGGLRLQDLGQAQCHGAHGVALRRGAWDWS